MYQKSKAAFYDFLNSGYLFVRQLQIQTYFYFNFSDTPCYRLHKTLPETDWYKGACAQVAKIFRCIDSALRVFGTKDAVLKKLTEICNMRRKYTLSSPIVGALKTIKNLQFKANTPTHFL